MQSGRLYLLRRLVPRISESAYSSLPTPSASTYGTNRGGRAGRVGKERPSLQQMARQGLWPTPTAMDGRSGPGTSPKREGGLDLRTAVALWPSPAARDGFQRGYTPASTLKRMVKGHSVQLPERMSLHERGPLNPTWVEWLMGFPLGWTDFASSETP